MTDPRSRDIAIVGMACVFPSARDLTQFWSALVNGRDAFAPARQSDQSCLGHDPARHDADDPEAFWLQHTVQQALQDADTPWRHGLQETTYLVAGGGDCCGATTHRSTCYAPAVRVAAALGSRTEAYHANAAAMRTLQPLAWGVQALRQGRCDLLIVAALHALPAGPGTAPAGNVAAVVCKRRTDAEAAGDRAYAFLKGVAAVESGLQRLYDETAIAPEHMSLLTLQGTDQAAGHADVIESLASVFGRRHQHAVLRPLSALVAPGAPPYTTLGAAALIRAALGLQNKLIPPTLDDASLPTTLQQLPFYVNTRLRPWIHDTSQSPRRVALHLHAPAGISHHLVLEEITAIRETVAVRPRPIVTAVTWDSELVVMSADTPAGLLAHVRQLDAFLQQAGTGVDLVDIAYTQHRRFRPEARCRLALVCGSRQDLQRQLELCQHRLQTPTAAFEDVKTIYFNPDGSQRPGKVAWVFPGLGFPGLLGPYVEHLRELCVRFPEVREVFDQVERRSGRPGDAMPTNQIFFPPAAFPEAERQRLRQRLAAPRQSDGAALDITATGNLSTFGVNVANWASKCLLERLEVPVDMLFGQSNGELSALCAAGALDFAEIIAAHWQVSTVPEFFTGRGRLALASASAEQLLPLLEHFPDVTIAIHIAPAFQILGGDEEQLTALRAELRAHNLWTQPLPYPAIHTPRFSSLRSTLEPLLVHLSLHPARLPVYSGMTARPYPTEAEAFRQTLFANLDHPVLLWQTTRQMYQDGARIFLQMDDGATMHAQARHIVGAEDMLVVSLSVDHHSATVQLHHMCAALLTHGVTLNLTHLYAHRSPRLLDMPPTAVETAAWQETPVQIRAAATTPHTPEQPETATPPGPEPDQAASSDALVLPFLGRILRHVDRQELVVERQLDLREDLFLAHHLFVYAEGLKPASACFPVLPMTVGMEAMAEVAAYLAPGYGLLGFEEVKARRWVALEDRETLPLRIAARFQHYDDATGTYRLAADLRPATQDTPAMQATVLFGRQYQAQLALDFAAPQQPRRHPASVRQLYEERRLFHGPLFQCIADQPVLAEHAVLGELTVLPKHGMFRSTRQPILLTDPILLDGVGQLVGLWAIEQGVYIFPIGLGKLECYRPTPAVGTRVPVYIQITQYQSRLLYADAEIQDGTGRVWMRLRGWGDWVFRWPERTDNFRRLPTRYLTSHTQQLPALPAGAVCQTISRADLFDFDDAMMARFYLHMDEMAAFWHLDEAPGQRSQWLLGRIAAKDAVRRWLASRHHTDMLHPAAFTIASSATGQPLVERLPEGMSPPALSIAHTEDRAIALAYTEPVGIDMARLVERQAQFADPVTTPQDRQLLARHTGNAHHVWLTRLRCAKEAATRLVGADLQGTLGSVEAIEVAPHGVFILRHHRGGHRVVAHTSQEEDFVIAYAVYDRGEG
jgi:acyl transferase domain-containing protein/phosphopantetheinyl transferase